jgi:hypothetical protein
MNLLRRFFFVCLLLLASRSHWAQSADSTTYWEAYSSPLDIYAADAWQPLALLDTVVPDYAFFFTAEQHWRTVNLQVEWAFLTYLHRQAGVRNLLLESSYSFGLLVNHYLATGDERLLDKILLDLPICPEEQKAFYLRLKAFNDSLPEADRIKVTGIDLEHEPLLALQALHTLKPAAEPPAEIAKYMEQLVALHQSPTYSRRELKRFFKRLSKDLLENPSVYASYWGANIDQLALLVANALDGYRFTPIRIQLSAEAWREREARMYENFLALQPRLAAGGYYAQFGALHTDLNRFHTFDFPSLAYRLQKGRQSPVKEQVLTISVYLRDLPGRYEQLGDVEELEETVGQLEAAFPGVARLLRIDGPDSPFERLQRSFQYLLVLEAEEEDEPCE